MYSFQCKSPMAHQSILLFRFTARVEVRSLLKGVIVMKTFGKMEMAYRCCAAKIVKVTVLSRIMVM